MKRKVTKMGPASLVVSLPSKWVKANKLTRGDTVEMTVEPKKICIELEAKAPAEQKIETDAEKIDSIIERWLGIVYKKGYDEVAIHVTTPRQRERIIKYIPSLIGYEIIEQKEGTLTIRNVTKDNPQEYDVVLKRIFFLLFTFTEELLGALIEDDKEKIQSVIYNEQINNKLTDYCKRLIFKYDTTENPSMHYAIVKALEDIADEYKYIALSYKDKKFNINLTPLFKEVSKYIPFVYKTYYKKDVLMISELARKRKKLIEDLEIALAKAKYPDSKTISNLMNVVQKTFDLNVPIATLLI